MVVLSFTIWFNLWKNLKFYNTGSNCVEILSNAEFSFPKLLHFFQGSRLDTNRNSFLTPVIHIFDLPFYQLTKDYATLFSILSNIYCAESSFNWHHCFPISYEYQCRNFISWKLLFHLIENVGLSFWNGRCFFVIFTPSE
jgi:hypothetical protein